MKRKESTYMGLRNHNQPWKNIDNKGRQHVKLLNCWNGYNDYHQNQKHHPSESLKFVQSFLLWYSFLDFGLRMIWCESVSNTKYKWMLKNHKDITIHNHIQYPLSIFEFNINGIWTSLHIHFTNTFYDWYKHLNEISISSTSTMCEHQQCSKFQMCLPIFSSNHINIIHIPLFRIRLPTAVI